MKRVEGSKEWVIRCFHCGNETQMQRMGGYSWGTGDLENEVCDFTIVYELYACPVCHRATLYERYRDETMIRADEDGRPCWPWNKQILFPVNSLEDEAVPKNIKEAYEAALKIKEFDRNNCMMALRRTLELMLLERGATKWGLKDKIEEIAAKGLLPDTLKEASSLAKFFGDSAAHGKELAISAADVEIMVKLIRYIMEYLYILPDQIQICKKRLGSENPGNGEAETAL